MYFQEDVHEDMLYALLLPTSMTTATELKTKWLHIRKTELVILCPYVHRQIDCPDWMVSAFTTQVKEVASEYQSMHRAIHREMLASQKILPEHSKVFQDMTKIISLLKVNALLRSYPTLSDQHSRLPCPSPTPRACSNSCPLSRWCHPIISSSVIPFSSCLQSFPVSGSFLVSQFFASGGQSIGASASASVIPVNIQD